MMCSKTGNERRKRPSPSHRPKSVRAPESLPAILTSGPLRWVPIDTSPQIVLTRPVLGLRVSLGSCSVGGDAPVGSPHSPTHRHQTSQSFQACCDMSSHQAPSTSTRPRGACKVSVSERTKEGTASIAYARPALQAIVRRSLCNAKRTIAVLAVLPTE